MWTNGASAPLRVVCLVQKLQKWICGRKVKRLPPLPFTILGAQRACMRSKKMDEPASSHRLCSNSRVMFQNHDCSSLRHQGKTIASTVKASRQDDWFRDKDARSSLISFIHLLTSLLSCCARVMGVSLSARPLRPIVATRPSRRGRGPSAVRHRRTLR